MTNNPYGLMALWTQGDWIIKGVAVGLLLMSVASWYVMLTRAWQVMSLRRNAQAVAAFWHAHTLAEGMALLEKQDADSPFARLAREAGRAVEHHRNSPEDLHGQISLSEWLSESLRGDIEECAERIQSGLPILASVGSTAPFVGLLGTVWGIYHALVSIGVAGQASIDKVAGPVGEALIMTACGLAVAIPAVLGYNALLRANKGLIGKLQRFARQLHAYFLTGSPRAKPGVVPPQAAVALAEGR